jgi:hypothetical protein
MYPLAQISYAAISLCWDRELDGPAWKRARQLRGALARAFADDDLFHQRDAEGRPLYRYPRVQYRWNQGHGVVVGWREAAERLLNLPWLDIPLQLGADTVIVTDAAMQTASGMLGVAERLVRYRLVSPVLLLNQENYKRYRTLEAPAQEAERDRLLVAQILAAVRGLGVNFDGHLYAAFCQARPRTCRYKEQDLLGFGGSIVSNALLPDGFAVGHAVSHGYGWLMGGDGEG